MEIPLLLALLGFLHFTAATSSAECTFDEITPSTNLPWCPCGDIFFYAKLDVPLDYQNPSLGRASVLLLKYPAVASSSSGPYQGLLLVNPGGPGASGVDEDLDEGAFIAEVLGSNWDVVEFHTRGMWLSEPVANCSANATPLQNISLYDREVPRVSNAFYNGFIEAGKVIGQQCEIQTGALTDAGPHMSSAIISRDMLSIVDAFAATEDGERAAKPNHLLNYYGIIYGTFIGQTFASMFPTRVGNIVLDGVTSPSGILNAYTSSAVTHQGGIIAAWFIYCHAAGPSACPYYTGSTPKDIYERFNASFIQLDPRKAETEGWSNATDLESALIELKVALLTTIVDPFTYFTSFSPVLLDLETAIATQNLSAWTQSLKPVFGIPDTDVDAEWRLGTLCSDQGNIYYKNFSVLLLQIEKAERKSIIGEIWGHRYFLLVTLTTLRPIENSFSSAPNFKNAQILVIDGMGPTIRATQNTCGFAKIAAYFQTNQLPGNESFCALEVGPFGVHFDGSLRGNIERAGLGDLVY